MQKYVDRIKKFSEEIKVFLLVVMMSIFMDLEGKGKVPKYGHVMGSMFPGSAA